MGIYNSIDELVDEIIVKNQDENKEIKKRKPKPFRYLRDDEIKSELFDNEKLTIMKNPIKKEIYNKEIFQLSMGDKKTIENIIKKHEYSRKIK